MLTARPRAVSFTVYGQARPKGSSTAFRHNKSGKVIVHAQGRKGLKAWEGAIRSAAQQVAGDVFFMDAVELTVAFYFPRPKSISEKKRRHMTVAPDLSKLIRGLEDAITKVLWTDDALVTRIVASKAYGPPDQPGCAVITITEVLPEAAESRLLA